MQETMNEMQNTIDEMNSINDNMKLEINKRDNTIAKLEDDLKILDDLKAQRDQMQQEV